MKLMNLLLILIVIMLQGCSVPVKLNQDSAPLADQDIVKHGTLAENYSRIIIYSTRYINRSSDNSISIITTKCQFIF